MKNAKYRLRNFDARAWGFVDASGRKVSDGSKLRIVIMGEA